MAIGFTVEKLYGPAWWFTLTGSKRPGVIFHEPPEGKMSFELTRRIGRTLHRLYGLQRNMYQLRKQERK
jgi:hypothetical protein